MTTIHFGDRSITLDEIQDLLTTDHPMVEQFRFEESRGGSWRGGVDFALRIIPKRGVRYLQQRDSRGRRVEPVWRTLSGEEEVGQGNRTIWSEGDELVAENCTFFPNQEFNDLGIGSALYVAMERFYRHLGISRVTLLAVDVGVYVWARQGFAFAHGGVGGLAKDLERFVRNHDPSVAVDSSAFSESWDVANFDAPGVAIDGYRAGKAFMLIAAPSWHGVKHIDSERHNAVAEASRRETFSRLPEKIEGAPGELAVR